MRQFQAPPSGVPFRPLPAQAFRPPTVMHPQAAAAPADERAKDAALLADIAGLAASAPLEHYFSNLHRALAKHLRAPIMLVGVRDFASMGGFKPRYKRDLGHGDAEAAIDARFIDIAVQTAKPVLHSPMPKLPTGGFLLQSNESAGSVMAAPLVVESQVLGYIAVRNPSEGVFDESDLARFATAANVAALVVRNDLTADEAAARRAELQLLLATARSLASERDLGKFFESFHGLVGGVMDAESFFVALGSWNDGGRMTIRYCVHHHQLLDIADPLPVKGSASGHVFHEGMPLLLRSQSEFGRYAVSEQGPRERIQSGIFMPLINGHRITGVFSAQSSKPNAYSVRERDLLEALGELCAIAIETSSR